MIRADVRRLRTVRSAAPIDWSPTSDVTRTVREYLAALNAANPPPAPQKYVSLTDPAASWTAIQGPPVFTYSTNYLGDVKAGIIVDVEASATNHTAERCATCHMIERVEQHFALKPQRLIGDTVYGTANMLHWLRHDKGIAPHIPVWERSARQDGTSRRWRCCSRISSAS